MNILAMRVDWNRGLGNSPSLYAIIEGAPTADEMIYTAHPQGRSRAPGKDRVLYLALKDGMAQHLLHDPGSETGFGGREFTINVIDKDTGDVVEKTIKGPWHGGPSYFEANGYEPCMEVIYKRIENFMPALVFHDALDRLDAMKRMGPKISIADYKLDVDAPDLIDVGEINMERYWRAHDAYIAADTIRRKYERALFDVDAARLGLARPVGREWEDTPEQRALVAELLLWDRKEIWHGGEMAVSVVAEAMERLIPKYTLYRRLINSSFADHDRTVHIVPAEKQSTGLMFGDDTPAPKEEGFWGYAVHDGQGYPKTAFCDTFDRLLHQEFDHPDGSGIYTVGAIGSLPNGWQISRRDKGQWTGLSPAERLKLPRQLRERRAA